MTVKDVLWTIVISVFVTVYVTWRLHGMVEAERAACPRCAAGPTCSATQGPTNRTPSAHPMAPANTRVSNDQQSNPSLMPPGALR